MPEHQPDYERIARDLRNAIRSGEYPPGSRLPKVAELCKRYGVAPVTARTAINKLKAEGLVDSAPGRGRGTIVRERPIRRLAPRDRAVYRDELGYYFDPAAKNWRALETPTSGWGECPPELAPLMLCEPGSRAFIRRRVLGDPEDGVPQQISVSYLPAWLCEELPKVTQADTGPGGYLDRIEEQYGPLSWTEYISARMPSPEEAETLRMPRTGVPLLEITRVGSIQGRAFEATQVLMSAESWWPSYPLRRHASAQLREMT